MRKKRDFVEMGFGRGKFTQMMMGIVHFAYMFPLERKCRVVIDYDPAGITRIRAYPNKDESNPQRPAFWREFGYENLPLSELFRELHPKSNRSRENPHNKRK